MTLKNFFACHKRDREMFFIRQWLDSKNLRNFRWSIFVLWVPFIVVQLRQNSKAQCECAGAEKSTWLFLWNIFRFSSTPFFLIPEYILVDISHPVYQHPLARQQFFVVQTQSSPNAKNERKQKNFLLIFLFYSVLKLPLTNKMSKHVEITFRIIFVNYPIIFIMKQQEAKHFRMGVNGKEKKISLGLFFALTLFSALLIEGCFRRLHNRLRGIVNVSGNPCEFHWIFNICWPKSKTRWKVSPPSN